MPTYGFYDKDIRQKFLQAISEHNFDVTLDERQDEFIASIEGDLDFDTELRIDEIYNTILGDGLDLWAADGESAGLETNAAGVRVQLSSGQSCQIRLETELMNKLLDCLTLSELENFVQQIASAVENPTDQSLCEM